MVVPEYLFVPSDLATRIKKCFSMAHQLINYFKKITSLSPLEEQAITASLFIKKFKAGDFIFHEGDYNQDSFFVLEGFVRQYKLSDGVEITTNFYGQEQWIISWNSFNSAEPANTNLYCVADTAVVVGNEQKAQALFKQFPRFETISRTIMEEVFTSAMQRMSAYHTATPEERYLGLLKAQPEIFQKVPQFQIASYIGVKPESLSRIRKRLAAKS